MGLSAVVITYNEEANIERCLGSLAFADEIVVVDSFSTDRTVEIARRYTDRVSCREFVGFSDQWNAAVGLARGDWVLVAAADEVVSDKLAGEIQEVVEKGACDAYRMPRLTHFLGRAVRHCGWYPDYQLRLARRQSARFPDRLVHETMEVDGSVGTLKHDLIHYGYPSIEDYTRRMIPYARAAARQRLRDGRRFRLVDLLLNPGFVFFRTYLLKQGFRDGMRGLVISVLAACSSALRHAVLWEMTIRETADKE